uniref:Uncharacterized protein n=1 Tax=Corethron hystrix TaxID=216773 RepID=A0A7S1BC99_9STRA|mmetsp:Transcript_21276/g.48324  ORF Transcript_21276/g.48324 Transcript_21276/m.48324 type:complete len:315 (+) Transcript_21276:264-1208(+)
MTLMSAAMLRKDRATDVAGEMSQLNISTTDAREPDAVERVIIFDWDDTICPSTFVTRAEITTLNDLSPDMRSVFAEICRCAEKALVKAAKYGEVIIITSADEGWVEYSAEKFVPQLIPVLKGIRVISARSNYEEFYPGKSLCWKAAAFAHEANAIFHPVSPEPAAPTTKYASDDDECSTASTATCSTASSAASSAVRREILSFGDSMDERTAVRVVGTQLEAVSKSIKFIPRPSPVQILGELSILVEQMASVCKDAAENIDVEISRSHAMKAATKIMDGVCEEEERGSGSGGAGSGAKPSKSKSTLLSTIKALL